jgi:RNA polymerase sporulation-specific sigma factor
VARISRNPQSEPKVDDGFLIALAKLGDRNAYDRLVRRYHGFVRLKASSYFLAGGDSDDLIQEGLVGLYKAIRDFRTDRESSFRNFAELCITRQIITAVKTATRNKHTPLNQYVSFSSTPAGAGEDVPTLDQILPGPTVHDPVNQVISSEELRSLVGCLSSALSELESRVLSLYLDGYSYEQVGERLQCDTKTVDNALQRVKRKVGAHLQARAVAAGGRRRCGRIKRDRSVGEALRSTPLTRPGLRAAGTSWPAARVAATARRPASTRPGTTGWRRPGSAGRPGSSRARSVD